jgi:two-component system cell cycle response regulator DivK
MSQPHVLIVDDNIQNINVLVGLLQMEGVASTYVTNPNQLFTTLTQLGQVDLIFLDLEMPGMNGFEVFRRLRSDARYQHVQVIACTIHISEIKVANQEGFDGFIGKPLNPDKFPSQLARLLHGDRVWETV